MNKWIAVLLIGIFAAGISVAGESGPWWKFGFGGNDKEQVENSTPDKRQYKDRAENRSRHRPQFSDEQRSQMKERYQAIKKLAEAARAETDPAKKAELTNQLRDKLTENAKKMQEQYRRRMKEAEKELAKMKERLDKGEADLEQRVEQKLQKLLAVEKPERKGKPDEERRRKNQNNVE